MLSKSVFLIQILRQMTKNSNFDLFENRHIGPDAQATKEMLAAIKMKTIKAMVKATIPTKLLLKGEMNIPEAISEYDYIRELREVAAKNKVFKSYLGQGYYNTITPNVISRNVFQNPGWYTQYTPYQAEIAQGRLEALLNFQTMVSDLTGLPITNASLLDEGTAAGEAMMMFYNQKNKRNRGADIQNEFFVDQHVYEQNKEVVLTRAEPLGIKVVVGDWKDFKPSEKTFGVLLQFPNAQGVVEDYKKLVTQCQKHNIYITVAADLLSLSLIKPPGEWGADAVVGNTQRFGVPMGYGGPHAAYFSTKDDFKRMIPGRIIGVSIDADENPTLRMALQTREQHIRREKATSNICTAQALLAIMASMYGVYHGKKGIQRIATKINNLTQMLAEGLQGLGYEVISTEFFDTLCIDTAKKLLTEIKKRALKAGINLFYGSSEIRISIGETSNVSDIIDLLDVFNIKNKKSVLKDDTLLKKKIGVERKMMRKSDFMSHPVFSSYQTETKMMRYIKRLENKDLSLVHSMIALGSCTMKLNAATQLMPVSWEAFANIHPFVPANQMKGYAQIFDELEKYLCEITGFTACSLQPNSGAQGEYTGLMTIRAYHEANGDMDRNIVLIPSSAHGTNPASAVMAGMEVVVVDCDENGNIDVTDLVGKAKQYATRLSALMVTYPSTHGVFETEIRKICKTIHDYGGRVYMDGANMNAQVGLTNPGMIGADVCHLNLHKTFAIPHGGGGPGMGPICVNDSLAPFLPGHLYAKTGGKKGIKAVSSAPWGSASILLISYAYIRLLGNIGLRKSTEIAILNANYIRVQLQAHYDVLYVGEQGMTAHELILDLRPFKSFVSAEDVAKRLIDYGFHAPTLSFPVAGTIMIEPTESESKDELDRFCEAMISIRAEIDEVARGEYDAENNVLHNAPHTLGRVTVDNWEYPYTREKAAYPIGYLREGYKFWPTSARVNNAYGDRNLICTCPSIESYRQDEEVEELAV